MAVSSEARSTVDCSSAPDTMVPIPPSPGKPMVMSPESTPGANTFPARACRLSGLGTLASGMRGRPARTVLEHREERSIVADLDALDLARRVAVHLCVEHRIVGRQ